MLKNYFILTLLLAATPKIVAQSNINLSQRGETKADILLSDTSGLKSATKVDLTPVEHAIRLSTQGKSSFVTIEQSSELANDPVFKADEKKFQPGTVVNKPMKAPAKAATFNAGYYISKDRLQGSTSEMPESQCLTVTNTGGSWKVNNIFGVHTDVTVDVSTAGKVLIPGQLIYRHSVYGDIYICPVDLDRLTYDPSGTIEGTIDENGKVTLTPWGMFVTQGTYKNASFGVYTSSEWVPSNTTITTTDINGNDYTFPSLIEQPLDNRIFIYNFLGYGSLISAQLQPTKTVKITPQPVYYNAMMGDAYCYPADWTTNKINTNGAIIGEGTENTIILQSWAASYRLNPTNAALKAKTSVIKTSATIIYPTDITIKFDGEGTSANPYKVSTADHLKMMSRAVENGNDFTGKYFSLETDINLANLTYGYNPIGSPDNIFNGIFNGNNRKISGLNANAYGENFFGLFGYLGANGEINGLNIDNFNITGTGSYIAPVTAYNEGRLVGCNVTNTTITAGGLFTGGIVAESTGPIYGCTFSGDITTIANAGGIAGVAYNTIEQCSAGGSITSKGYLSSTYHNLGGIVGSYSKLANTTARMNECFFYGTLTDTYGYSNIGGLVGVAVVTEIEKSFNVGSISAKRISEDDTTTGGLIGMCRETKVSNCYNAGTILKSDQSEAVGGLVGYLSVSYQGAIMLGGSEFSNCYNSGIIKSTSAETHKGVFGDQFAFYGIEPDQSTFTNCYFDTQVAGFKDDTYGRPSSYFLSSLPADYSTTIWSAQSNRYPVIATLNHYPASKLSAAAIIFSDNEDASKVKKSSTLSSDASITWRLSNNSNLTTETPALKIEGDKVNIKNVYSNETLVAFTSDGTAIKYYTLAVVPKLFEGDGTESSPYLIKTINDFKTLNSAVTTYGQAHNHDYFKLANDIDFNHATDFMGVGAGTLNPFGGILDGDGHHLKKLDVRSAVYNAGVINKTQSYTYGGLFSATNANAVIKNLIIDDDCVFDFYNAGGTFVGYNLGRVENCKNYAHAQVLIERIGGIAGQNGTTGVISGCYNAGMIQAGKETAGGIVGYNNGKVELCQNDGDINAMYLNDQVSTTVYSTSGGIIGLNYGNLDRSVNNGNIRGDKYVGGLIGYNSATLSDGAVSNSINNGLVHCINDVDSRGGIIGYMTTKPTLTNNYYDGSINVYGAVNNRANAGIKSLSTSALVAGKLLDGLNASDWNFKAGVYPVLAKFADEEAASKLRSIYMNFAEGEVRTNVTNTITLSSPEGISWKLRQNQNFKLDGNKLNVTIPTEMVVATDTLTATLGKYTKMFEVKAIPEIFDGKGTSSDPFRITSIDDMNTLSSFIALSKMDYNGFYFKLMNDLDYTGKEYNMIAGNNVRFQADFDGNGKRIKNLNIENTNINGGRYIGMFGIVGEAGSIHDLTVSGSILANGYAGTFAYDLYGKITNCVNLVDISTSSTGYAGGFACNSYEGAEISNCVNKGSITTKTQYAGGFISRGDGSIVTDCVNEGNILATTGYAGGIAAQFSGRVENCVNKGDVSSSTTSAHYVGGIIAKGQKDLEIYDCHNESNLTIQASYLSGILAYSDASSNIHIADCYNTGNLSGLRYIGGIGGTINPSIDVRNCYNTGDITGQGTLGGVIASLNSSQTLESYIADSYNTGKVTCTSTSGSYVGGFIGTTSATGFVTIEDCYNLGDVEAASFGGGFAGSSSGITNRCWNGGNIHGVGYGIGGFSGIGSGTATACFNLGNVSADGNGHNGLLALAGGIWGYGASKLQYCFNLGTITASNYVGGVSGAMFDGAVIQDCYNAGKINTPAGASTVFQVTRFTQNGNATNTMVGEVAFDKEVNPDIAQGNYGTGLTTREMATAKLGDGFVNKKGSYPVVSGVTAPHRMHWMAASFLGFENDDDNEQNVSDNVYYGDHETLIWKASDGIVLKNGVAYPVKTGEQWIQATQEGNDQTRKFILNVLKVSKVEELDGGREVVSRIYFDLNGRRISEAQRGEACIIRTTYSDGSTETVKAIIR